MVHRKIITILFMMVALGLRAQGNPKSLRMMGVVIEGHVDSVATRLRASAGLWTGWGNSDDGEDFFFRGKYYGIRAKLMLSVRPENKRVTSAYITVGPYSTKEMLERNLQYFLLKISQEHGELEQNEEGWVRMDDEGSIKVSIADNDNGSREIRVLYFVDAAYYKDAVVMGLKGPVQEVVTENAVSEDQFMHFSQDGQLENPDYTNREYDNYGYLRKARVMEKEGYSLVVYEYNNQYQLAKRTMENPEAGITYIHEYTYNEEGEVATEHQKVYQKEELIMNVTLRNSYLTRDQQGNWTTNSLTLTYWEKGIQSQVSTVLQKRTIDYWE